VTASADGQVDLTEPATLRVDDRLPLLHARLEKLVGQPHRLERLERTRVDHGGAVPVHRSLVLVDDAAFDAPAPELGPQEQPGGTGTDDEDGRLVLVYVAHARSSPFASRP